MFAKVVPIFEIGERVAKWTISLPSYFSIILENIVATRLTDLMAIYNLLSLSHYDFRKKTLHPAP
jgi:hypothetical protein